MGKCRKFDENKVSKNTFIDSTFHHPPGFYQLMIIMYKDIITGLKKTNNHSELNRN